MILKSLLSTLFLAIIFCSLNAQNKPQAPSTPKIKLDQNAQVRGANGLEIPYEMWQKLYKSGKFGMKLIDGKNPNAPIFMMYELSAQEIENRNERMPKPRESGSFKDGDKFEYFTFRDTENKKYKAEDLKGKVIVLNFWFINCPPCRQEIPELNTLVDDYKTRDDIIFIGIGLDPWVDVKEFIKKSPFNYHLYTDARPVAEKYGVRSYPTHVVVDKTGTVIFQTCGLAGNTVSWIKKSIESALETN